MLNPTAASLFLQACICEKKIRGNWLARWMFWVLTEMSAYFFCLFACVRKFFGATDWLAGCFYRDVSAVSYFFFFNFFHIFLLGSVFADLPVWEKNWPTVWLGFLTVMSAQFFPFLFFAGLCVWEFFLGNCLAGCFDRVVSAVSYLNSAFPDMWSALPSICQLMFLIFLLVKKVHHTFMHSKFFRQRALVFWFPLKLYH